MSREAVHISGGLHISWGQYTSHWSTVNGSCITSHVIMYCSQRPLGLPQCYPTIGKTKLTHGSLICPLFTHPYIILIFQATSLCSENSLRCLAINPRLSLRGSLQLYLIPWLSHVAQLFPMQKRATQLLQTTTTPWHGLSPTRTRRCFNLVYLHPRQLLSGMLTLRSIRHCC